MTNEIEKTFSDFLDVKRCLSNFLPDFDSVYDIIDSAGDYLGFLPRRGYLYSHENVEGFCLFKSSLSLPRLLRHISLQNLSILRKGFYFQSLDVTAGMSIPMEVFLTILIRCSKCDLHKD